jgi:hypothetical protein
VDLRRFVLPAQACGESSSGISCRVLATSRVWPERCCTRRLIHRSGACCRLVVIRLARLEPRWLHPVARCPPRVSCLPSLICQSSPAGSLQGESPRPAALVAAPPLCRGGLPATEPDSTRIARSRPHSVARPAPLARLNRHSEACCHVGPTRLTRPLWPKFSPREAVSQVYSIA